MGKIIKYTHHGNVVSVDEDLKGKHKEHCLCYRCSCFKPNTPENCPIAQATLQNCLAHKLVTPVFECPKFEEEKQPDVWGPTTKVGGYFASDGTNSIIC